MSLSKAVSDEFPIKIWLGNLAKYNAGSLVGKWLLLPMSRGELAKAVAEILGSDEEYQTSENESNIDGLTISHNADAFVLNEIARKWVELDYEQRLAMSHLMSHYSMSFDQSLESIGDVEVFYGTMEERAQIVIKDEYNVVEFDYLKPYIDFEKFARGEMIHRGFTPSDCGRYVFIYRNQ